MKLKKGFIRIGLFVILVAIVVSIYVFLSKDDGEKILVSRQNILHGTIITESNFDEYVYTINTDKSMKPDDVIMEKEQIIGRSVIYDIAGNTIITDSVLSDEEEIAIHMNNTVFKANEKFFLYATSFVHLFLLQHHKTSNLIIYLYPYDINPNTCLYLFYIIIIDI